MQHPLHDHDLKGWLHALLAFGWWGFIFPLVVLWSKSAGSGEIHSMFHWSLELLALRILFCLLFCLGLLLVLQRFGLLIAVFRSRRLLLWFAVSSGLIFLNWLGFIIGATTNNLSQTSLGYYMGPIFNVLLGFVFLGERLRKVQFAAVCVAGMGILWLALKGNQFPWIAIVLAVSFGFYGLVRKRTPVDSIVGMTMECLFCLPICFLLIGYLAWATEGLVFVRSNHTLRLVALFTGPATAIPLISFSIAAQRLRLGTLGFIQFVAPTGQLILSLLFDSQPITTERLIGYGFVWAAVGIYLVDLWRANTKETQTTAPFESEKSGSSSGAASEFH